MLLTKLQTSHCRINTAHCTLHIAHCTVHSPLHLVFLPCLLPSSSSCSSLVKAESIVSRSSPKSWYRRLLIGSDWIDTIGCYWLLLDHIGSHALVQCCWLLLAIIILVCYFWLFCRLPDIALSSRIVWSQRQEGQEDSERSCHLKRFLCRQSSWFSGRNIS